MSHFVWGDTVRGSGAEDQVMTARRRLIQFYLQTPGTDGRDIVRYHLAISLEGTPRLASSGPGEDRAGGKRRHRGIDLSAEIGEPVRAVADGTVIFAGVNLPSALCRAIPSSQVARYRWKRLGAGGILCLLANKQVFACTGIKGIQRRDISSEPNNAILINFKLKKIWIVCRVYPSGN